MSPNRFLSERALSTRPFYVMEILARSAQREKSKGPSVSMVVGEPDFAPPPLVVQAAEQALRDGKIHYTHALGMPQLREAIAQDYLRRDRLVISPERIAVTAGGSGGLLLVMAALLNAGDEVLMPDPSYPCNREFVRAMGAAVKTIPVDGSTNFQPTVEQVRKAWSARTKALLVASPANPTGTMLTHEDARGLAALVYEKGGVLIVDEIYQRLVFESSPVSLASLGEDIIVINSFSKTFSMTGWRLGWVVAPGPMMSALERLSQNLFISPSSLAQQAALAAFLPGSLEVAEDYRHRFRSQGQYLLGELERLGFALPARPAGAFYGYCDVSKLTKDSFQFCFDLCDRAGVLMTPGRDFGDHESHRFVRVSFTKPIAVLQEGVHRLQKYLGA
jgi:aspartate/methionine/tyrosine aminotransferase